MNYKYENVKLGDYERVTDTHVYFWRGPISQWAYSEFTDSVSQKTFINCEQWMMWNKTKLFDESFCDIILNEISPKKIQELGRLVKNFDESVWKNVRYDIVLKGNLMKFQQNEDLRNYLLSAGDRIFVEASPYDKIWGVGLHETDDKILDEKNWNGLNLLGKAITETSKIIRGI